MHRFDNDEEKRIVEILEWIKNNPDKEGTSEFNEKQIELQTIFRFIDRIHIREYADKHLANYMEEFIRLSNEFFQDEGSDDQIHYAIESDLFYPGVYARNMFRLIPPFVKQGVKIPENISNLYAESRYCFVFEQFSAAIVLSRTIIETALKMKIGLAQASRDWTAGIVLQKAYERKIINDSAYSTAKKVIYNADNILHQAKNAEYKESLDALEHTKEFLEELFG
jgi:hypothetical protein